MKEVVSWFGWLFLQVIASNFSFYVRQWKVQSTLLFLAVVCSPFWEKIMTKNMFSNGTMSEIMAADRVWNGYVANLLRFYCEQLALLTWLLLKVLRAFLSQVHIQIERNLLVLKFWEIIQESGKIDGQILNNLYKSMKDWIFNLISSKGGNTKF